MILCIYNTTTGPVRFVILSVNQSTEQDIETLQILEVTEKREEISRMDQLLIFHRDSMTGTNMKNNILYKFL